MKQYTLLVRRHRPSSFSAQGFAILNDSTLSIENFIRRLLRCINVISFAVTRLDPEFHSDINDIFCGNAGEPLFMLRQSFWKSFCWGKIHTQYNVRVYLLLVLILHVYLTIVAIFLGSNLKCFSIFQKSIYRSILFIAHKFNKVYFFYIGYHCRENCCVFLNIFSL